ncbi:hypothetical protein BGW38_002673 [Lunasporangiospora selenospora]|uniref:Glutathione S-transferase n=1 Tax=Lunasporangiospora selenospora TaxID=979761 RepID=A0A9P6FSI4_9FUNG|nr:hypothetical protein BGW38_002673 [Lunasporangiospora selenospora]
MMTGTPTAILPAETASAMSHEFKNSKFIIHYFEFHGIASATRTLLAYGGASWENRLQKMEEWPKVKPTTPCGTLPVLTEMVHPGGDASKEQVIAIPESGAMERYLARKFNLLGETPREEVLNDIFYAQAVVLNLKFAEKVIWTDEELRPKAMDKLINQSLVAWVEDCERHLAATGNTGHFVGNKFTLADIRTAAVLDTFLALKSEHVLNEAKTPGLFKLKRTVDSHPGIAAWRRSDEYKQLDETTQKGLSTYFEFDMSKSHLSA